MKKSLLTLPYILPVLLLLLQACSGKSSSSGDTGAADTLPSEISDATSDPYAEGIPLDSAGLPGIRVGMPLKEVPRAIEGMYDRIIIEDGVESNTYVFINQEVPRFTAYEFGSGRIDVLSVDGPGVYAAIAGADKADGLRLGDQFRRVLDLPGVVAEYESVDEEGMWVWHIDGLWFQPDQTVLPDELSRRLYDSESPAPGKEEFTDDVVIGYIGTGLPW